MIKAFLKRQMPIRLAHSYYRALRGRHSQSNEGEILGHLVQATNAPKTFIEFGFNINQFNCIDLTKTFRGLLIDGDEDGVKIARHFLPPNVKAESRFLTMENLDTIESALGSEPLGIVSIDVDGNDYWFLERLLSMRPAIVSCEYNASMENRAITVPYDPKFIRSEKHTSGWYHGASLMALTKLCKKSGYDLVAVDSGGINGFFVRSDLRTNDQLTVLDPITSYRENQLRNAWSGTSASDQWQVISDLPFVSIE